MMMCDEKPERNCSCRIFMASRTIAEPKATLIPVGISSGKLEGIFRKRRNGGFVWILLPLLYFAYLFQPVLADFSRTVPSFYPDVFEFIWNAWWISLPTRSGLYFTDYLFQPGGASLLLHTFTEGILI